MPERADRHPAPPRPEPLHAEPPHARTAPRRSETVRNARRGLHRERRPLLERLTPWLWDFDADPAVRGAGHVRVGLTIAAIAVMVFGSADIIDHGAWWSVSTGVLVGFVVAALGVLASSAPARVFMLLIALVATFSLDESARQLRLYRLDLGGYPPAYVYTHVVAAVAFVVGTVMATLTPAAFAYHRAQRAASKTKREHTRKSLAEWRRG